MLVPINSSSNIKELYYCDSNMNVKYEYVLNLHGKTRKGFFFFIYSKIFGGSLKTLFPFHELHLPFSGFKCDGFSGSKHGGVHFEASSFFFSFNEFHLHIRYHHSNTQKNFKKTFLIWRNLASHDVRMFCFMFENSIYLHNPLKRSYLEKIKK
ncbi:Disease resistance protein [Gossypium australe]|uniref:Disease resistance protein n=1 Tax=Gossypium australe TaxID=47621 RepID=A0A5B6U7U6_9ROSI|nr:Disease resistance protein [Gossypium australe]